MSVTRYSPKTSRTETSGPATTCMQRQKRTSSPSRQKTHPGVDRVSGLDLNCLEHWRLFEWVIVRLQLLAEQLEVHLAKASARVLLWSSFHTAD